MNKHYMITISEDQSALHGLRFVGRFVDDPSKVEVTLYFTAQGEAFHKEILGYEERATREAQRAKREDVGQEALDKARETLVKSYGFREDHIKTKLKFRTCAKAVDILAEAEEGMYDAMVLGRRGLSRIEELMDESVSRELMTMKKTIPVWICRSISETRDHVLLCIDDSKPSERITDHVGYVLADEKRHNVVLFHAWDPDGGTETQAHDLVDRARKILVENGVDASRISREVVEGSNYTSLILDRVEKQDFAAVAVGRTGEKGTVIQRLFMGAVSTRLLNVLEGTALWVSH